jgi:hypothetical protein
MRTPVRTIKWRGVPLPAKAEDPSETARIRERTGLLMPLTSMNGRCSQADGCGEASILKRIPIVSWDEPGFSVALGRERPRRGRRRPRICHAGEFRFVGWRRLRRFAGR